MAKKTTAKTTAAKKRTVKKQTPQEQALATISESILKANRQAIYAEQSLNKLLKEVDRKYYKLLALDEKVAERINKNTGEIDDIRRYVLEVERRVSDILEGKTSSYLIERVRELKLQVEGLKEDFLSEWAQKKPDDGEKREDEDIRSEIKANLTINEIQAMKIVINGLPHYYFVNK